MRHSNVRVHIRTSLLICFGSNGSKMTAFTSDRKPEIHPLYSGTGETRVDFFRPRSVEAGIRLDSDVLASWTSEFKLYTQTIVSFVFDDSRTNCRRYW